MQQEEAHPIDLDLLKNAIGERPYESFISAVEDQRQALAGRTLWHVNSTAQGGGVAEMLLPMLGYARSLGIDFQWLVIDGDERFFEITKRLHNYLHGHGGDGGPLGDDERRAYEATLKRSGAE